MPIEITPTTVRFPWFRANLNGDEVNAYAEFITALCQTAIKKKRVTAQPINTDNPRFSMRVWLVSLGMIGPEYGLARKLLIGPLPGESGWRFGKPDRAANVADTAANETIGEPAAPGATPDKETPFEPNETSEPKPPNGSLDESPTTSEPLKVSTETRSPQNIRVTRVTEKQSPPQTRGRILQIDNKIRKHLTFSKSPNNGNGW